MSKFVPNNKGFIQLVTPTGLVGRGVAKAAGKTRDRAKQEITTAGRVNTGAMRQSVASVQIRQSATSVTHRVGTNVGKYPQYQEDGTGPGRIYPRRAKALRFKGKGGVFIFAKSVAPIKGAHFMKKALRRLTVRDFS